jgi:hypothetical protein
LRPNTTPLAFWEYGTYVGFGQLFGCDLSRAPAVACSPPLIEAVIEIGPTCKKPVDLLVPEEVSFE